MAGTMKSTLFSVALFIAFASCAPLDCRAAAITGKALYLITNEDQNAIVSLPINPDGSLGQGTSTSTGGAGSVAVDAAGDPATPDALLSQSALKVAGNVSGEGGCSESRRLTSPAHLRS